MGASQKQGYLFGAPSDKDSIFLDLCWVPDLGNKPYVPRILYCFEKPSLVAKSFVGLGSRGFLPWPTLSPAFQTSIEASFGLCSTHVHSHHRQLGRSAHESRWNPKVGPPNCYQFSIHIYIYGGLSKLWSLFGSSKLGPVL